MRWYCLFMLPVLVIALSAPSCAGPGDESHPRVLIAETSLGRGWLGVAVEDMTERMGRRMGAGVTSGALVNEVMEKSPAEKAGLKVDDIIVSVDDRTIKDADDLVRAVRKIEPETAVSLVVVRGGKRQTVSVEIGSRGEPLAQLGWVWPDAEAETTILGMTLRNLTGQLAEFFKAPRGRAVLVENVSAGSAAAEAGVKAGDVIIRCGSEPIRDVDDLEWVLEDATADQKLALEVLREGAQRTMELTVPRTSLRTGSAFLPARDVPSFSFRSGSETVEEEH